jgi:hypothetical protein
MVVKSVDNKNSSGYPNREEKNQEGKNEVGLLVFAL